MGTDRNLGVDYLQYVFDEYKKVHFSYNLIYIALFPYPRKKYTRLERPDLVPLTVSDSLILPRHDQITNRN